MPSEVSGSVGSDVRRSSSGAMNKWLVALAVSVLPLAGCGFAAQSSPAGKALGLAEAPVESIPPVDEMESSETPEGEVAVMQRPSPVPPGCVTWGRLQCDGADLRGFDFRGMYLEFAVFRDADVSDARFDGVDMEHAWFIGTKAVGTSFLAANLRSAKFHSGDLSSADFRSADLREVDFNRTRARNADFWGADTFWTLFTGSDLSGATWHGGRVCRETPPSIGGCQ